MYDDTRPAVSADKRACCRSVPLTDRRLIDAGKIVIEADADSDASAYVTDANGVIHLCVGRRPSPAIKLVRTWSEPP